MSEMYRTRQVLLGLRSAEETGFGLHMGTEMAVGGFGTPVGEEPFDPLRHRASDIDPLATGEMMFNTLHVTRVMPSRPLELSLVVDSTSRHDAGELSEAKASFRKSLLSALVDEALPATEQVDTYEITDSADVPRANNMTTVAVSDRWDVARAINDIKAGGLTMVVSDFSRINFAPGSLKNVVAIKLNHRRERQIEAGKRIVTLAGGVEIDTASRWQVRRVNRYLDRVHQGIVGRLNAAGAEVVSLVADEAGFDSQAADRAIAEAVNNLQKKQN